jgi:hypothetical protein
VDVNVFVGVFVGVAVNVFVGVDVDVAVGVLEGVTVLVGVGVFVGFGAGLPAEKTLLILEENNSKTVNDKPMIFTGIFVFFVMNFLLAL